MQSWPGGEVIGVMGVEEREDGVAELGPLAVSLPGRGVRRWRGIISTQVGSGMLGWAEARHRLTAVGVVSCRTDLLLW